MRKRFRIGLTSVAIATVALAGATVATAAIVGAPSASKSLERVLPKTADRDIAGLEEPAHLQAPVRTTAIFKASLSRGESCLPQQKVLERLQADQKTMGGKTVMLADGLQQSFADVYSTAVSIQNLKPFWDRRLLAATITALATAGALWLNISDYENFLTLIGSVFVPLSAVLIIDYFVVARGSWDLSGDARTRWLTLVPWAVGFVVYQLINPGYVSWWASAWTSVDGAIGFTPATWMSASILSFVACTFAGSACVRVHAPPSVYPVSARSYVALTFPQSSSALYAAAIWSIHSPASRLVGSSFKSSSYASMPRS